MRDGAGCWPIWLPRPAAARLTPDAFARVAGWPDEPARVARAVQTLVEDGLVVVGPDGALGLP